MTVEGVGTAQAAALAGMSPATFRVAMTRLRDAGTDLQLPVEAWPDRRTPLWNAAGVRDWVATRPGTGTRSDLETVLPLATDSPMLLHLAAYGIAAIAETVGRPLIGALPDGRFVLRGVSTPSVAAAVRDLAVLTAAPDSWARRSLRIDGRETFVAGSRWPLMDDVDEIAALYAARHALLDSSPTIVQRWIKGAGEPLHSLSVWEDDTTGGPVAHPDVQKALLSAGVSAWDLTPRQRGGQLLPQRIVPLAEVVAGMTVTEVEHQLLHPAPVRDHAAQSWGLRTGWSHIDTNPVIAWCAYWALSLLPTAAARHTGVGGHQFRVRHGAHRIDVSMTSTGHLGRPPGGWLWLPWPAPTTVSRIRNLLRDGQVSTAAYTGADRGLVDLRGSLGITAIGVDAAGRLAGDLGVLGIVRAQITDDGNLNSPRRFLTAHELLRTPRSITP